MDAAQTIRDLLELWEHEVPIAYEGQAALEVAARTQPQVVLLDLGLPGMDGYEVAQRLRAWEVGTAPTLIALTGYGQEEDRRRSQRAGFDHHLVKPVDPSELHRLLATISGSIRAGD